MRDDITDDDGKIIITQTFITENLGEGINTALAACGIQKTKQTPNANLNKNKIE